MRRCLNDDRDRCGFAPLAPLRRAVLEQLRDPASASEVAARLGESRQRVNYHVRELERAGLVEFVEERARRGCTERVVRATSSAVVVEPVIVGEVAEQDRFAADALLAGGARLVRDVAAARRAADERGQRLLTFSIEAEVGFARPSDLERFADALADRIAEFARRVRPRPPPLSNPRRRSPDMSMDKPFRVEVEVDAPRDVVWRELTEPERIRHWFGWEYDGLDDEIKFIFVDHAKPVPPDRIELVRGRHDRADRARRQDADPRDQAGRPRRGRMAGRLRRHRRGLDHVLQPAPVSVRRRRRRAADARADRLGDPLVGEPGRFAVVREPLPARRDHRRRAGDRGLQGARCPPTSRPTGCCSSPRTTRRSIPAGLPGGTSLCGTDECRSMRSSASGRLCGAVRHPDSGPDRRRGGQGYGGAPALR